MLSYRTTPIQGGAYSPAELLMSRKLRTTLPSTRKQRIPKVPDAEEVKARDKMTKDRQKRNFDKHHGARVLPPVDEGDRVWIPTRNEEATVIDTDVAPRSHVVRTEQGSEIRRNRRDMIQLPEQQSAETEQPPLTRTENERSPQSPENDQSPQPEPRRSTRIPRPTEHFAPYIKH